MTLKLVTDNTDSNVTELPVGNLMDIAGMARKFAEHVEEGQYGHLTRTVLLCETETGLAILGWGENTSPYELMGLFEAAKLNVFADFVSGDE